MIKSVASGKELAGLRVMVIDDSKTIRRTLKRFLSVKGVRWLPLLMALKP